MVNAGQVVASVFEAKQRGLGMAVSLPLLLTMFADGLNPNPRARFRYSQALPLWVQRSVLSSEDS
jgi:hypothetical protein